MSRKQKAYRAWYKKADAEDMNVQTAFAAGWDAHKKVAHAHTIQELQAENQRLREIVSVAKNLIENSYTPSCDGDRQRWLVLKAAIESEYNREIK